MPTIDQQDDIPRGSELALRLTDLTVPYQAIAEILAVADRLDDEQRAFIDGCRSAVLAARGSHLRMVPLPTPPGPAESAFSRFGFVLMYAAMLPDVRRFHAQLGVDAAVSWATLADLGRNMYVFEKRFGVTGFDEQSWLSLHFSGQLYQLGRLQFQVGTLGKRTTEGIRSAGLQVQAGEPTLSVHIPRFLGSLSDAECDTSLAIAGQFFGERFPDLALQVAVCKSWLLDPQLLGYLGGSSNIAAFQHRFALAYPPEVGDADAMRFVFDNPDLPLDQLPQDSSLQRAVVQVLATGGHWHAGMGWFRWER